MPADPASQLLPSAAVAVVVLLAFFFAVLYLLAPLMLYGVYSRLGRVIQLLERQNEPVAEQAGAGHVDIGATERPRSTSPATITAPSFRLL